MKSVLMTILASTPQQVAGVLATDVEVVNMDNRAPAVTGTEQAVQSAKRPYHRKAVTVKAKTAGKATKRPGKHRHRSSVNNQTPAELLLAHFAENPNRPWTANNIAAVMKRHGFKSSGYSAMCNLFARQPDAPVKKLEPGVWQSTIKA